MGYFAPQEVVLKDGSELVLRSGVEDDAAPLIRLIGRYLEDGDGQVMVPGEFTNTLEQERKWISDLRKHPNELLLLPVYQGHLVGNLNFHVGKRERTAHVGEFGMAVLPEWRGRGLGKLLLETLLTRLEANPCVSKVNLRVLASNERAQSLYRALGFREEGRIRNAVRFRSAIFVDEIFMGRLV